MRTTVILAAALLATACNSPDSGEAEQARADDAMTADGVPGATGSDGMAQDSTMMAANVSAADYVSRAAISDMYEIEAGKLAVQKGETEQIRKFGQMMVDDHTKSSQEMKSLMAKMTPAATAPSRLDAEHQGMIDRLKSASGAAFDREYQNQQMMAHRKALALHEGFGSNGDNADLKAFAQKVTPVVRKHHDQIGAMAGTATTAADGMATGQNSTGTTASGANPRAQ